MAWDVVLTDECRDWYEALSEAEQVSIIAVVDSLVEHGPRLRYPASSGIAKSAYAHMRELRVQHAGRPYRILYAFDPARTAVLLIGGDKTGDDRWYDVMVPRADKIYAEYLRETGQE